MIMSDPLIGEIRFFAFEEPPEGWLPCDGQILTRSQYPQLFDVLGTLYGGDGRGTFAVPDLRGRVAVHPGHGVSPAETGGEETHELTLAEMPNHNHLLSANQTATSGAAANHFWSAAAGAYSIRTSEPDATLSPHALAPVGDGQPHTNLQPYLTLNVCIATHGALPKGCGSVASAAFLGEVRLFAGSATPSGWAPCDGQLLSTRDHTRLFAVLGTTFGGDGQNSFALPDLRGRVALGSGRGAGLSTRALAESAGDRDVMLTQCEMPMHSHAARCAVGAGKTSPDGATWSGSGRWENSYAASTDNTLMSPRCVEFVGGNAAHNNMQPYLGISYVIALEGTFPEAGGYGHAASSRPPSAAS
jgi:microcystin-dependent protein